MARPGAVAEASTTTRGRLSPAPADQPARAGVSPEGETIAYGRVESPIGPLWVAVGGRGIVQIVIGSDEEAFLAEWRATGAALVRDEERIHPIAAQLADYFRGARRDFDLAVDLGRLSPFQQAVLRTVREVPAGQVVAYADLAARVGKPEAARAVGNALAANPVPIVVPCHRVVRRGGRLGGYTGGLDRKRFLLKLEGAL